MSRRHFDSRENADLRAKIDDAKRRLPLPELMSRLGLRDHAKKRARCPFHDDENPSFSVLQRNGSWFHRCFAGCSSGDEIAFLVKHFGISRREAIKRYLEMAGFPPRSSRKSHKCPESPESLSVLVSESPCVSVSPVSEGQTAAVHGVSAQLHIELRALATRNVCSGSTRPEDNSWQLARGLKGVVKRIDRKLHVSELMIGFDEWHRLSQPFLDADKPRDYYWITFLAQVQKARVPSGEGTISDALQYVSKLTESDLPTVPGYCNALEVRRVAALHRELARRSEKKDKRYFLAYRDAAKVCEELSHQTAHTITFALASAGVIEIIKNGKAGLNSGKASEFRYVLPLTESSAQEDDGLDL